MFREVSRAKRRDGRRRGVRVGSTAPRGLGAIVEGATRTFQGHRVGELVLGALLEDLRGGRKGRSVPIMPGSARLANATITGARSTLGRGRRARGVHAEASRAKIRIDGRGDDVQHLMTRRDASRARSRAAEARWWFFLTRGLRRQIGKMARDGPVSEGACAYLHDGLGRAPRGAGAHADLRGGGGGNVERHGSQWSARGRMERPREGVARIYVGFFRTNRIY